MQIPGWFWKVQERQRGQRGQDAVREGHSGRRGGQRLTRRATSRVDLGVTCRDGGLCYEKPEDSYGAHARLTQVLKEGRRWVTDRPQLESPLKEE